MTTTLFFSSLPSAPTRIPRPHIWLKTDRKQFTVWYSGSVYPRNVWATQRLCIIRNCSAKFNRADTKSRRFMKNFRSLFSCLHFKPICNRKRKKCNFSMKFRMQSILVTRKNKHPNFFRVFDSLYIMKLLYLFTTPTMTRSWPSKNDRSPSDVYFPTTLNKS